MQEYVIDVITLVEILRFKSKCHCVVVSLRTYVLILIIYIHRILTLSV